LVKVLSTTGINDITRVGFYNGWAADVLDNYDCAHQDPDGPMGNNTKYCLEARFEACAMKYVCPTPDTGSGQCSAANQLKLAEFYRCAEYVPATASDSDMLPCAKSGGLDWQTIQKCATSDEPLEVIQIIGNKTHAIMPKGFHFPNIQVNGVEITTKSVSAITAAICEAYTGSQKPEVCGSS